MADPLFRFAPDMAWSEPRLSSLYTYSLNNALRYFDPDGRCPFGAVPCGGPVRMSVPDISASDVVSAVVEVAVDVAVDMVAGTIVDVATTAIDVGSAIADGDLGAAAVASRSFDSRWQSRYIRSLEEADTRDQSRN
jgi:hypothetical protein